MPVDYRRRATRSDFWLAYQAAFPARTHRFCGKEEDETNHAERFFGTLRARAGRLVCRSYASFPNALNATSKPFTSSSPATIFRSRKQQSLNHHLSGELHNFFTFKIQRLKLRSLHVQFLR